MRIRNLLMMAVIFCGMIFPEGVLWGAPYLKQRLQPEVIWGRFCLTLPMGRTGTVNVTRQGAFPLHFYLSAGNGRMANAEYRYAGRQEFILISCRNGFSLLNFRADRDENTYVLLLQDRDGKKIHLETGTLTEAMKVCLDRQLQEKIESKELHGENVLSWQADSFWELVFCHPEACREALGRIFSIYAEDAGQMDVLGRKFANALIEWEMRAQLGEEQQLSVLSPPFDPERADVPIRELILQLDSDDFSVRRHADEMLRRYGIGVFMDLGSIESEKLSPEARFRLTHILEHIEKNMKLSQENYLHDVQFWVGRPAAWVGGLAFGTPEQQEQAWRILKRDRFRFFPDPDPSEFLAGAFQNETFSTLTEEEKKTLIYQFKEFIFSAPH